MGVRLPGATKVWRTVSQRYSAQRLALPHTFISSLGAARPAPALCLSVVKPLACLAVALVLGAQIAGDWIAADLGGSDVPPGAGAGEVEVLLDLGDDDAGGRLI